MRGKRCPDCGQAFVRHGRAVRCHSCQYNHTLELQKVRDANRKRRVLLRDGAPVVEHRHASERPVIRRADFALHFLEMKRQLDAMTHCLQPRDYRTPSPLELSTLGEHRPRTGRPRSAQ
jgi:hypothetical protein